MKTKDLKLPQNEAMQYEPMLCAVLDNGDKVIVMDGTTKWMKDMGYWMDEFGETIDGHTGEIVNDYTHLNGNDSHFGVNIGFDYVVGIHPRWLRNV